MNNQPTTAVRRYPQKPERTVPVMKTKTDSAQNALACLNEFVKEARKEIKKRERVKMELRHEELYTSMSFLFDDFSLSINFKEGITV